MPDGADPGSGGVILGDGAVAAMEEMGRRIGIICTNCGGSMEGPGFEFISLRVEQKGEKPTVIVGRTFVCGRDDCAEARETMRGKATAVRDAGGWTVFTGPASESDHADSAEAH